MKIRITICLMLIFGVLLFSGGLAQAQLVTVGMTAQVTSVSDYGNLFHGDIAVGDTITGYYTYDLATPDLDTRTNVGDYETTSLDTSINLNVSNYVFSSDPSDPSFWIGLSHGAVQGRDYHFLVSYNNLPVAGRKVEITWQISDLEGDVLLNDSLPASAPNLANWSGERNLIISGRSPDSPDDFYINAEILAFTPEPATVLLVGLGATLLRKKSRK